MWLRRATLLVLEASWWYVCWNADVAKGGCPNIRKYARGWSDYGAAVDFVVGRKRHSVESLCERLIEFVLSFSVV
jgi:hypothetical protein